MDFMQFIVMCDLLFFSPYVVPLIATFSKISKDRSKTHKPKSNIGLFWTIQVVVCLSLAATAFYLIEVGTFNGLININMLRVGVPPELFVAWEVIKYASGVFGGILGAFLIYRGVKFHKAQKALLISLGVFCLIYGIMQPYLMQLFVGGLLDSHLIG